VTLLISTILYGLVHCIIIYITQYITFYFVSAGHLFMLRTQDAWCW